MESVNQSKMTSREKLRDDWLLKHGFDQKLTPMAGDASGRCYFRLKKMNESFVLMDAALPEHDCERFVRIARLLQAQGVQTPDIIAADSQLGFLILSDFGDKTYLKSLTPQNADQLYSDALQALVKIQASAKAGHLTLDSFSRQWMEKEWQWHQEWFLEGYLQLPLDSWQDPLNQCMQVIIEEALTQPQVFMHRDYHSGNLMQLADGVGVLDFQDAFIGPVTYDLVSLLRDCYIVWPAADVSRWVEQYYHLLKTQDTVLDDVTLPVFTRQFDLMGLQRHLKAIMTFSRKHLRDGQSAYLQHIPPTLSYITGVSKMYPELQSLHQFVTLEVLPRFEKIRKS